MNSREPSYFAWQFYHSLFFIHRQRETLPRSRARMGQYFTLTDLVGVLDLPPGLADHQSVGVYLNSEI